MRPTQGQTVAFNFRWSGGAQRESVNVLSSPPFLFSRRSSSPSSTYSRHRCRRCLAYEAYCVCKLKREPISCFSKFFFFIISNRMLFFFSSDYLFFSFSTSRFWFLAFHSESLHSLSSLNLIPMHLRSRWFFFFCVYNVNIIWRKKHWRDFYYKYFQVFYYLSENFWKCVFFFNTSIIIRASCVLNFSCYQIKISYFTDE